MTNSWFDRRRRLCRGLLTGIAMPNAIADLADLIESAQPSVVAVGTYDALQNPRFSFRGTGFVVDKGTRVVTNAHVVARSTGSEPDKRMAVLANRGGGATDLRQARQQAIDEAHDLAILEIDGAPLPALALAAGPIVRPGTGIALIGFPLGTALGFVPVTHRGIVSAVAAIALPPPTARQLDAKTLSKLREGPFEILQLDATAYPGNSGSPLLSEQTGQVIGVINMVFVKSTKESAIGQPTGITYAIPVKHVSNLLVSK